MALALPTNLHTLSKAEDPKTALLKELSGAHEKFRVLEDDVLVATYIRATPKEKKSAGGIIIATSKHEGAEEDVYQGKVALVLKKGPSAFKYNGQYEYEGTAPDVGEWVVLKPSAAWSLYLNGVSCRLMPSDMIRGVIEDPAIVY